MRVTSIQWQMLQPHNPHHYKATSTTFTQPIANWCITRYIIPPAHTKTTSPPAICLDSSLRPDIAASCVHQRLPLCHLHATTIIASNSALCLLRSAPLKRFHNCQQAIRPITPLLHPVQTLFSKKFQALCILHHINYNSRRHSHAPIQTAIQRTILIHPNPLKFHQRQHQILHPAHPKIVICPICASHRTLLSLMTTLHLISPYPTHFTPPAFMITWC